MEHESIVVRKCRKSRRWNERGPERYEHRYTIGASNKRQLQEESGISCRMFEVLTGTRDSLNENFLASIPWVILRRDIVALSLSSPSMQGFAMCWVSRYLILRHITEPFSTVNKHSDLGVLALSL